MKFFEKRGIALAVLVLAIAAAVFIGQSRKAGYIENQPVTLPQVAVPPVDLRRGGHAVRHHQGRHPPVQRAAWDSRYYAVIAVATVDDITGWTPEEAAQQLGADWGLGANDMLLLMVRDDDYYVACGDNVLAVLNSYDTMQAKLKQAIEDPPITTVTSTARRWRSTGRPTCSTDRPSWAAAAAPLTPIGRSLRACLCRRHRRAGRYPADRRPSSWCGCCWTPCGISRYRRRYVVGAPVNVVRPVYYPIFWGRPRGPRPPRPPRGHRPPPPPPYGRRPPSLRSPAPARAPVRPGPITAPPAAHGPVRAPARPGPRAVPAVPPAAADPPVVSADGGFGGGSRSGGSRGGGFGKGGFGGGKR